jgi:hypothetical protein
MSTTNPHGDGPLPGAGRGWPADVTDLDRPDESGGGGGVSPAALRAGHEPDVFKVAPILSIPVAVVVTFVIAFAVATAVFFLVIRPGATEDPFAHPEAVARNRAPLNQRLARIDRAGADTNLPPREVDQPRLEWLRILEADGQTTTRPELPVGNSPEIHPEDVAYDRYPGLQKGGWVEPGKVARLPIGEAIRLAATDKGLNAQLFPVRKDPSRPVPWPDRAQESNAGRTEPPPAPKVDAPKDAAPKAPDPKPAEKKDNKEPEKKEPAKGGDAPPPPKPPEKK